MLMLSARFGLLVAVLALTACSDYLDRRDTLMLGAGEAVQTNIVAHQIDPWPAYSRNVSTNTSGERAQRAIERYRSPQRGAGEVATGTPATAPTGAVPVTR